MKIAVVTKPNTENHKTRLGVISELENMRGCETVVCENADSIPSDADRVLVFGGDGTMLDAVRAVSGSGTAVLGVNLGNLGFMTSFEQDANPKSVADAILCDEFKCRTLLEVKVDEHAYDALNEVVVKSEGTRPISLDVFVDGRFVDSFHSDGIIVSTPAGSTAYSLSAGGPVLAPNVDAFVINPICAHSLHSRPLVISANSKVSVRVAGDCRATVSVDGYFNGTLEKGGCVDVRKSERTAKFVDAGDENFYGKLLRKMNRWGTTLR